MENVIKNVEKAKKLFRDRMTWLSENGGITEDIYTRILSMEYHLTNGVQRHFMIAASHPCMAQKRSLRKFLCDFANEEELHYKIAYSDLENLNRKPVDCPIDVHLWKAYFDSIILERPFQRLGGTCVLENISSGARDLVGEMIRSAKFLNKSNTRFIVIHQHDEKIPHGEIVIEALSQAKLDQAQMKDLEEGSRISTILFLRMIDWCISGNEIDDLESHFI